MTEGILSPNVVTETCRYPAFSFKPPGIVADSLKNSFDEEVVLCHRLTEDTAEKLSRNSHITWFMFNNRVASVLQGFRRPMCGLVALNMAGEMLLRLQPNTPQPSTGQVLQEAVKQGMSKQGEIFSVYDMAKLAEDLYKCKATVLEGTLNQHLKLLLTHLLKGHATLVPYDNDRNFEPCMRNGNKAHWTIVTGAVIGFHSDVIDKSKMETLPNLPQVFQIEDRTDFHAQLSASSLACDMSLVYVFTKQGKSAKNRLWRLDKLSASNGNLEERDPSKDWNKFHCPYLLTETLQKKSVILHF